MACCLAIAFLIGISRTAWRWALRRPEPVTPFPPPARRPAPGEVTAPPAERSAPSAVAPAGPDSRPVAASILFFAAVGAALYAFGVATILSLGGAEEASAPAVDWLTRHAAVVVLAAAALVSERLLLAGEARLADRGRVASALIGTGLAWIVLGVLDQHLFGLFAIAGGNLAWDLVFHGAGSVAILAGWALLATRPDTRPVSAATG